MIGGTPHALKDWTQDRDGLAFALAALASKAGRAIMSIYETSFGVLEKQDGSPLTKADLAADEIIQEGLGSIAPEVPILSEETADATPPDSLGDVFFVVDPLDGTREFVDRNGDFSINIALVKDAIPIVGLVYAPAHNKLWLSGETAYAGSMQPGETFDAKTVRPINTCGEPHSPMRAVASRFHRDKKTKAFLKRMKSCDTVTIGSALKFCLLAEGKADVYPRYSPTMVWDTAAGVAILQAAGGFVCDEDGRPLQVKFGKNGWRNGSFTAWNCKKTMDSADHTDKER